MQPKPKIANLLDAVKEAINNGRYIVSRHAWKRSFDREISLPDIKHVLFTGHHESKKDQWSTEFKTWKYSIKGKTFNKVNARVVIAIDDTGDELLIIITVINLDKGN